MLPREYSSHGISRIDDVHKRSLISDQTSSMLEINLKVLLFLEFIADSLALHGWAKILIKGVANLWHEYLIALIAQGNQHGQEAHVDSMVDLYIPNI